MANHINITDPDSDSVHWYRRREADKVQAELKSAYAERDHYQRHLESIFTRIGRGEEVWLCYADGRRIAVVAKEEEAANG